MFILNLLINFILLIGISFLCGALCAIILKTSRYLFMSALIPWIGFLTLNLISEYNSPDKELIKGTWIFFQLTIGTIIAITGFIGGLVVLKLSNKNNVPKKLN